MEESFEPEYLQEEEENCEDISNPLEIVNDYDVKKEGDNEQNITVDEALNSSSCDTQIEDYINYIIDEEPKIEKPSTRRKEKYVITQKKCTNKPKLKLVQHDDNILSELNNLKMKSQIDYIKSKTKFYTQEIEKLDFARTLMILKTKKTRLEIAKLKDEL